MAQLHIPDSFFRTEVRDGFPIGEMMKRNWAAQLQVLEDVRELCSKYDIKWFAFAGTELGAVRHKGFIPWDDDIDICMRGEDFINFLYYAEADEEFRKKYIPLTAYGYKDWDIRDISRIGNAQNMNFSDEHLDKWHNCPLAIGTDFFPLYYIPRDKEKEAFIFDLFDKINALFEVNEYNVKYLKEGRTEESKELQDVIAASIIGLQEDTGFEFNAERSLANQLCQLWDQIGRFTTEDEADYVARIHPYMTSKGEWKIRKEAFDETIELPFETITVPSPKDYDMFCRVMYGSDYMTPVRGGTAHDYPYFGKQLRVFQSKVELRDWLQKLKVDGTYKFQVPVKQKLSESKNEKTVILYYTSVREMLIYGEYVIDKINDIISYFEKNKDTLQLWWCPGDFNIVGDDVPPFKRLVPELIEKYEETIRKFKESGLGICDESGNLNKAVDACDMYYGDEGFLSELFGESGKPVYIQDYHTRFMGETPGCIEVKASGIFEKNPEPEFDEAVYLEDGVGYASPINMNGLFKIDNNNKTCEYIKAFINEKPDGQYLYTGIRKMGDKLLFIPGSADNAVLFDPKTYDMKEYNVYSDTYNNWFDFLKYADCIENEGIWYFFGERYPHILKVDPKTGEKEMISTGYDFTIWMRHAAIREGGLVKLVSANTSEMLTFNLRTGKLFVKKEYSQKEMLPKLQECADKMEKLKDEKFTVIGDFKEYKDSAFKHYSGDKGMVIKENIDWFSFEEMLHYVDLKKKGLI